MEHKLKNLEDLVQRLRQFAAERDWDQFHSPKNLAMALGGEAGELLEVFQWKSERESSDLDQSTRELAAAEMADVFIYLVRLADKLGIDLLDAAARKLADNELRYPASEVRGSSKKR